MLILSVSEGGVVELPRRLLHHAAAEAEDEVERRLLRDVVLGERGTVLDRLAGEDDALLVGREPSLSWSIALTLSTSAR